MTLRLKRLEIQGFKSFANRTVFDLADGLTAIIGPNGSGKSNFSDAVRWALGEQSNSALRGRRGEDVIFAGGGGRAALGMAEVALTLDNSDGSLPVEFSEVTIARRIFRDGETHYLLNGGRVRLRDLLQVTAPLGQSYTVIGQGLVDAALSARPEERRGLFEHAAGIAAFRMKRAEAERRLTETEANCDRLIDLRTELEPRLRSLERAAKGAQEWEGLQARLREGQQVLFAELWQERQAALVAAEADEATARTARETASAAIATLTSAADQARAATAQREAERRELATRASQLTQHLEPLRRDLAIGATRLEAIHRQLAETRERTAVITTQQALLTEEAAKASAVEQQLAAKIAIAQQEAATVEQTLATAEQARAAAANTERHLTDQIAATERERLALARRRAAIEERRASLGRDHDRIAAERTASQERAAALAQEATAITNALATAEKAYTAAAAAAQAAHQATTAAVTAERNAQEKQAAAERHAAELRGRLDGLQKLVASGEGYYSGVRVVMAAAQKNTLTGIIGPVAGVLDVPAELETAIEVALGGHLQDIVVERWADAEAAISLLRDRKAGRATFQPLDTIRSGESLRPPHGTGVIGVGADLVQYAAQFATLVQGLLGRSLIVEDLATTRRILPQLRGSWSIITRSGEITRTSGAVTGGSATRESGVLARQRSLRDLPKALAQAEAEIAANTTMRAQAAATIHQRREEAAQTEAAMRQASHEREALQHTHSRLESDQRTVAEILQGLGRRTAEITKVAHGLTDELAIANAEESALADRLERLEAERSATATAQTMAGHEHAEQPRLIALRAEIARANEEARGLRQQRERIERQLSALTDETTALAQREADLVREEASLGTAASEQTDLLATAEAEAAALDQHLQPLNATLAASREAEAQAIQALGAANQEALRAESVLGAKAVETARRRADLEALIRQICNEMDLADPSSHFTQPVVPLPPAERQALASQVERLTTRLRRMGPPNPEALIEWEREAERWHTLTTGLSDVESAARSLRGVLAELDRTMAERFGTTFARVAEEFSASFTDLFGGGVAKLVLAEGEGAGAGGVEIVAQPPGKKLQTLSLLSGGERALTAAALLFAILRVNPSPFCILDEVDAALDESNVVRFRERLKSLTERTQMVVITHNRGTIEGADTLYGITMGQDGVSRILSMRLDGSRQPIFAEA